MKNVLFGLMLVACLALMTAHVEATNLITNPGFESGSLGWAYPLGYWGNPADDPQDPSLIYGAELTTEFAHSGTYSLKYIRGGVNIENGGFYGVPWIMLEANTDYILSFWIKTDTADKQVYMMNVGFQSAFWGTWPWFVNSYTYFASSDWTKHVIPFNSGVLPLENGGYGWVHLTMGPNSGGPVYLDDFEFVVANPPPVASISVSDAVIPVPVFFEVSPQSLNVKSQGDEFTAAQLVMDTVASASATANVPVSLSASDSNGTIASYEVKLDGVSISSGTAPPASITLLNVGQGSHTVTLNVTDNGGASASAEKSFSVSVGSMTELLGKNYNLIVNGISIPATAYDPTVVIGADRQAVINAIGPVDGLGVSVTIYITGYVTGSDVIEAFDPTGGRKIGQ